MDTQECPTCHRTSPIPNTHTLLCASLHPSHLPPKPASGQHILGLHFPPSSHTPEPTWIPLSSSTDEETSITFQSVDVSSIFRPAIQPEVLYTDRNRVRDRDTESMLEIWTLPPSIMSSEPWPNKCIADLLKFPDSRGGARRGAKEWRGPVLALAMTRATGFMVDPGTYKDISVRDAEDVVDFLGSYGEDVRGEGFWDGVGGPGTDAPMDVVKEEVKDGNEMEGRSTTGKEEDGLKVKCICGCDTWQHTECYYPSQGKKMRFNHLCEECKATEAGQGKEQEVEQGGKEEQPLFEVMQAVGRGLKHNG